MLFRSGVEDVRFDNWTMNDVGQGINVTNYYLMEGEVRGGESPVSKRTPVFRDIAISNMTIRGARVAADIEGLPEMPISGLRIGNVIAYAKSGLKAYNTAALQLVDVEVNAAGGPAFLVRDSKDLRLDNVSSREPLAGAPVIRLDRCPGAVVRASRAFEGTGTFLSVGLGELKKLVFEDNMLTSARKPALETKTNYWRETEPATEAEPTVPAVRHR